MCIHTFHIDLVTNRENLLGVPAVVLPVEGDISRPNAEA